MCLFTLQGINYESEIMINRIYYLTTGHLKRYLRNKSAVTGVIFFPLIFIGIFGMAFGFDVNQGNETIELGIINSDDGIPDNLIFVDESGNNASADYLNSKFLSILSEITFEDNLTKVFNLNYYSKSDDVNALKDLQRVDIQGLIILDSDFSIGVLAAFRNEFQHNQSFGFITNNWYNYPESTYKTQIKIQGDQTLQKFGITAAIVNKVVNVFFSFGEEVSGTTVEIDRTIDSKELSVFDYLLPGLLIFGIMQTLGTTAVFSVSDVESGVLRRLKLTNIHPWEYTISLILCQLVVSLVQVPIFFYTAVMFGFPASFDLIVAFLFAMLVSLCMTGIGLILASIGKSANSTGSMSSMISVPMAFLSGAFFITPNPIIIPKNSIFGKHSIGLMDLLPPTTAIDSLRLVLIGGIPLSELIFEFIWLITLTIIYLSMGIFTYSRKHLKPES